MVQLPVFPQELNLSYQDLGDPFQRENFLRILRRLIRVEKLQLVSDWLTDLSSVRLPRWEPPTHNAPNSQPQGSSLLLFISLFPFPVYLAIFWKMVSSQTSVS